MKPAAVDYARPRSLSQALELLARPNTEARVIAGGQSLVAMMNLRVASPGLLVDIARCLFAAIPLHRIAAGI